MIGAGSTVFMKNLVGDILQRPSFADATIALQDIDPQRLRESEVVAHKLRQTLGTEASIETAPIIVTFGRDVITWFP